jgi:hypothetical protein
MSHARSIQQTLGLAALTALLGAGGPATAREKPPMIGSSVIDCAQYDAWYGAGACAEMCRLYQFSKSEDCYIKGGFAYISFFQLWRFVGEAGEFEAAELEPGHGIGVEIGGEAGEGGVLTLWADAELLVSWEASDGVGETLYGATVEVAVGAGDRVSALFIDPSAGGVVQLSLR